MTDRRIDAAIFDLGNTLVAYYRSEEFESILHASICAIGEELERGGRSIDVQHCFSTAQNLNRESEDGRVWPLADRLTELLGSEIASGSSMDALIDAFLSPIFATARIDPQAIAVLETLRANGINTAIVSNTPWGSPGNRWRDELARLGLLKHIDAAVFCVDVGWRKPASAPFSHAMSLLKVLPQHTVFIGDDPVWDIEGAQRVGIEPILLSKRDHSDQSVTTIGELEQLLPLILSNR